MFKTKGSHNTKCDNINRRVLLPKLLRIKDHYKSAKHTPYMGGKRILRCDTKRCICAIRECGSLQVSVGLVGMVIEDCRY
jgi:hypothetical protein